MSGRLTVVGLGPGPEDWVTQAAARAVAAASDLVGYEPYLARLPEQAGQRRHGSDNRVELDRARHALALAASGAAVAVVSGGDPGVFAMAAAVFEALDATADPAWRDLDIAVEPGVTAMLAAAARVGAPLGGDFCAISLSDNLKPWEVVERRLRAVLEADFVVALYNPVSRARPWQLGAALDLVATIRAPATPLVFARAVGRPDERVAIRTLAQARHAAVSEAGPLADMATLVIVGASGTRLVPRGGGRAPFVYTPRSVAVAPTSRP